MKPSEQIFRELEKISAAAAEQLQTTIPQLEEGQKLIFDVDKCPLQLGSGAVIVAIEENEAGHLIPITDLGPDCFSSFNAYQTAEIIQALENEEYYIK